MPRELMRPCAKVLPVAFAAILCFPLGSFPAWAGPREDAAAAMARCDSLKDNAAWLDCHERATTQMRAALSAPSRALPPAPAPGGLRSGSGASAASSFGEESLPRRPRASAPKRVVARVQDVSFSKNGYFTVGLDNGQWWRQVDGDTAYARFREPANRNVITIERGFIGSYNLHIQGLSQGYKVDRIR
jgi:hypothetical protein